MASLQPRDDPASLQEYVDPGWPISIAGWIFAECGFCDVWLLLGNFDFLHFSLKICQDLFQTRKKAEVEPASPSQTAQPECRAMQLQRPSPPNFPYPPNRGIPLFDGRFFVGTLFMYLWPVRVVVRRTIPSAARAGNRLDAERHPSLSLHSSPGRAL
ncbi:MAG: hypothetical protein LBE61_02615 [Burkholderiaceae bacterium]|nr:hypothetical protein [Burkholderiaceae bacterium]